MSSVRSKVEDFPIAADCVKLQVDAPKLDDNIDDKCPNCNNSPHDTRHLFNCTDAPRIIYILYHFEQSQQWLLLFLNLTRSVPD